MKLFRRLLGDKDLAASLSVPDGYRLYAVGDVHGRDDLLGELLRKIEMDSRARGPAQQIIVFLGDLIDRGPKSAEVVERLCTLSMPSTRLVFLAGNHEEVLLRIIDGDAGLIADWLRFGGAECLRSYGADPVRIRVMEPRAAVGLIRAAVPRHHVDFFRSFDDTFRAGDFLFVHAGIRPGVPLDDQLPSDLRWIRQPFLSDRADHGFIVVHGHTIREQVDERANRIGIDTGAYRYGVLTALALEGSARWLIAASAPDERAGPAGNPPTRTALDVVSGQSG
jgi:serine/threonine protein phosphatase 1